MSDTTPQTGPAGGAARNLPSPGPTKEVDSTADVRPSPLVMLAEELVRRGLRADVDGGTLLAYLGAWGERVIACDGARFRWGNERGYVLGEVGHEAAAAERIVRVLRQLGRRA